MLVYFHLFTVEICWASSYLSPLNIIHQPLFMHHFDLVTPSAIWWFLCNHIHHQGLGLSWLMCQVCWSGFKRRCYDFIPCLPYLDKPHFSSTNPWCHNDIIMTSSLPMTSFYSTITSLWPHFLPMTSFHSTMTSSPKHYKYALIS